MGCDEMQWNGTLPMEKVFLFNRQLTKCVHFHRFYTKFFFDYQKLLPTLKRAQLTTDYQKTIKKNTFKNITLVLTLVEGNVFESTL